MRKESVKNHGKSIRSKLLNVAKNGLSGWTASYSQCWTEWSSRNCALPIRHPERLREYKRPPCDEEIVPNKFSKV